MLRSALRVATPLLLLVVGALQSGCIVARAVYAPVKLAGTTVVVASETAGSAVIATGRVAGAALGATGSTAATGIEALASLSQTGMVTFVDAANGAVVRVPWREGMDLYAGAQAAQLDPASRTIDLVRAGRALYSNHRYNREARRIPVQAGDVIRLVR